MANEVVVKEKGIASFLAMPEVRENITNVLGKDHVDSFVADVVVMIVSIPVCEMLDKRVYDE